MLRELLPVLIAGLVPIVVILLIVGGTVFNLVAWQPPIIQTVQFGTSNSQNGVTAISSDLTGVYAAGFVGYSNVASRSVTPTYLFINKYGFGGQQIWSQQFGNPSLSEILGIAVGTEGLYDVGLTNQSSFVTGYYLNGSEIWTNSFGHAMNTATAVANAVSVTTNSVYVSGHNSTTVFLRDYALNGSVIWTQAAGTSASDTISIFAGSDALYLTHAESASSSTVTGTTLIQKYGLDGTLVWTRMCQCDSAQIAGGPNGLIIAGTTQTQGGLSEGFVGKYDSNGNQLWSRGFSATGFNSVSYVEESVDSSGIYLATITSNNRGSLMKYDDNGNSIWSLQLPWETGTVGYGNSINVVTVEQGGVYVGGTIFSTSSNNSPAFVSEISESSSLVFFGVNPPGSFAIALLLAGIAVVSLLSLRRGRRKRLRVPNSTQRYPPHTRSGQT